MNDENNETMSFYPTRKRPIFVAQKKDERYYDAIKSLDALNKKSFSNKGHVAGMPELLYIAGNNDLFSLMLTSYIGDLTSGTSEFMWKDLKDAKGNIVVPIFHGGAGLWGNLHNMLEPTREVYGENRFYTLTNDEKTWIAKGIPENKQANYPGSLTYDIDFILRGTLSVYPGESRVVLCRFKDVDELKSNFGTFDKDSMLKNKIAVGRAGSVELLAKYLDSFTVSKHTNVFGPGIFDTAAYNEGSGHLVQLDHKSLSISGDHYRKETRGRFVLMSPESSDIFRKYDFDKKERKVKQ